MKTEYDIYYWSEKIENIMNNFDFNRVYRAMEALEWTWEGSSAIPPHVEDLRKTARSLLERLIQKPYLEKDSFTIGTGGFMAEIYPKKGCLSLRFEVSEWEDYDPDEN